LDLVNADGTQIGEIYGSTSIDGTSMSGVYHIIAQGTGGTAPCVDGDNGTVTLTIM